MLRRLLNIASIVCLVLCVALMGMWVRSYQRYYMLSVVNPISSFRIDSGKGRLSSVFTTRSDSWSVGMETFSYSRVTPNPNSALGFYAKFRPGQFDFDLPYWFLVLLSAIFALSPWIRSSKRVSLRTLLIATTLVAVVLGMIAWVDHSWIGK